MHLVIRTKLDSVFENPVAKINGSFFRFLFFLKSNIITWCKMRFEALLDGDINLQDNVQPINMSVCSLRLSVAGRPTCVSLSSSGCPSSLPLCAHRIFIASLPCYAFCLVMLDSSWALTLFFFFFFFSYCTHMKQQRKYVLASL